MKAAPEPISEALRQRLTDLRELSLAITPPGKGTSTACGLGRGLQQVGMTLDDLNIQPITFPDMMPAFANRAIDAPTWPVAPVIANRAPLSMSYPQCQWTVSTAASYPLVAIMGLTNLVLHVAFPQGDSRLTSASGIRHSEHN